MIDIIEITKPLRQQYQQKLYQFEQNFTYPLGNDSFAICHGQDYFAFFDLLGKPHTFVLEKHGDIVGLATSVLQYFDIYKTGNPTLVWYLCDVKVHPKHRSMLLLIRLLKFAFQKYAHISQRLYAISMNKEDKNKPNKLVKLAQLIPLLKLKQQATLLFYLLSNVEIDTFASNFKRHFNSYGFISLNGIKDIILQSNGKPMHLSHLVHTQIPSALDSSVSPHRQYMISLPSSHPMCAAFEKCNIKPTASASVIANVQNVDWSFVTSNKI